jgi:hypothetical protein
MANSGRSVPGMMTVTAGLASRNLRKNCAQLVQSMSAAKGGSGRPLAREKRRPRPNGRFTITAMPRSRAAGRMRSSALRLSSA